MQRIFTFQYKHKFDYTHVVYWYGIFSLSLNTHKKMLALKLHFHFYWHFHTRIDFTNLSCIHCRGWENIIIITNIQMIGICSGFCASVTDQESNQFSQECLWVRWKKMHIVYANWFDALAFHFFIHSFGTIRKIISCYVSSQMFACNNYYYTSHHSMVRWKKMCVWICMRGHCAQKDSLKKWSQFFFFSPTSFPFELKITLIKNMWKKEFCTNQLWPRRFAPFCPLKEKWV